MYLEKGSVKHAYALWRKKNYEKEWFAVFVIRYSSLLKKSCLLITFMKITSLIIIYLISI